MAAVNGHLHNGGLGGGDDGALAGEPLQGGVAFVLSPRAYCVGGEVALVAARGPGGASAGWFAAWPAGRKPVATAVRMDAGALDPHGAPAAASLLMLTRDRSPIFDDPTVSGALRAVLAGPRPDAGEHVRAGLVALRRCGDRPAG